MADNYLEKKMEELRSGSLAGKPSGKRTVSTSSPKSGKGAITFPFPPKSIIIVEPYSKLAFAIASYFHSIGCRVATLGSASDSKSETLENEYRNLGIRVISSADYNVSTTLIQPMTDLLRDWKRVDIIINFSKSAECTIANLISEYLAQRPAPTDYLPRILSIISAENWDYEPSKPIAVLSPCDDFYHFAVRYDSGYGADTNLRHLLIFLSLPQISQLL